MRFVTNVRSSSVRERCRSSVQDAKTKPRLLAPSHLGKRKRRARLWSVHLTFARDEHANMHSSDLLVSCLAIRLHNRRESISMIRSL